MHPEIKLFNGSAAFDTNCTLHVCGLDQSALKYRPDFDETVMLLVLFGILLLYHVVQAWHYKKVVYSFFMIIGCILEMVGYSGRLVLYKNPFSLLGFVLQSVFIPVASFVFCFSLFWLLPRFINFVDRSIFSRAPWVFHWLSIFNFLCLIVYTAVRSGTLSGPDDLGEAGVILSYLTLGSQFLTLPTFAFSFSACIFRAYDRKIDSFREPKLLGLFVCSLVSAGLQFIRLAFRPSQWVQDEQEDTFRVRSWFVFVGLLFRALVNVAARLMLGAVSFLSFVHPGFAFRVNDRPNPEQTDIELTNLAHPPPAYRVRDEHQSGQAGMLNGGSEDRSAG